MAGQKVTKQDMIWCAVASLVYPETSSNYLVSEEDLVREVQRLFGATLTPLQYQWHLVSWRDRMANKKTPSRGGCRLRYLFRTKDGQSCDRQGDYRLYRLEDRRYDGRDKDGRTHPEKSSLRPEHGYLVDWYLARYYRR